MQQTPFTDPRLCAAIIDRLTFGGNIIETGTDSYRLAHAANDLSGTLAVGLGAVGNAGDQPQRGG